MKPTAAPTDSRGSRLHMVRFLGAATNCLAASGGVGATGVAVAAGAGSSNTVFAAAEGVGSSNTVFVVDV